MTEMFDPDSDNLLLLDSDYYPMTTSNKLYDLICQSAADDSSKKKSAPFVVNQSILTSAFKFLAYYNNTNGTQDKVGWDNRKPSQKTFKSKSCLTVFSSPYKSKKPEISTELPSYVKKMMEKDASLRRLLKTGNVTISHIPHRSMDPSLDGNSDDEASSTKFLPICRTTERNNCQGSNLLKQLAKKASMPSRESESSNADSVVDVRAAVASIRLQYPSRVKARVKQAFRKPTSKSHKKNFWLPESVTGHNQNQSVKAPSSQDNDFDPTRFLEVSFREEESDEHRRKYKCPHCIKKFCWSTDLKRHILTHTGERPFSCEYCSANFTRKFLMQKHTRKHHQDQLLRSSKIPMGQVHNGNGYARSTSKVSAKEEILEQYVDDDDMDNIEEESVQDYGNSDSEPQPFENFLVVDNEKNVADVKPIVINVFSSMNGNGASKFDNDSSNLFRSEDSFASLAAPRRINQSIVKQITKANLKRSQGNVGGRKLSMLIPS